MYRILSSTPMESVDGHVDVTYTDRTGWVESMGTRDAAMDKSIDPKVAEALMYAWRAREVLRLPQEFRVDASNGLVGELRELLGENALLA